MPFEKDQIVRLNDSRYRVESGPWPDGGSKCSKLRYLVQVVQHDDKGAIGKYRFFEADMLTAAPAQPGDKGKLDGHWPTWTVRYVGGDFVFLTTDDFDEPRSRTVERKAFDKDWRPLP